MIDKAHQELSLFFLHKIELELSLMYLSLLIDMGDDNYWQLYLFDSLIHKDPKCFLIKDIVCLFTYFEKSNMIWAKSYSHKESIYHKYSFVWAHYSKETNRRFAHYYREEFH